jgi:hypothetical protein
MIIYRTPDISVETLTPVVEDVITTIEGYTVEIQTDSGYYYIGRAVPGSLTSSPVWQIKRVDPTVGIVILWADGDNEFDNVWDDYLLLSYS